ARAPLLPPGRPRVGGRTARQGPQPHLAPAAARLLPHAPDGGAVRRGIPLDHLRGRGVVTSGLRAWGPALVWAAVIFALSSRPTLAVGPGAGLDKVPHLAGYAVLGAAPAHGAPATGWSWLAALALGLGYAFSDELHQSLVPGRSAELGDW